MENSLEIELRAVPAELMLEMLEHLDTLVRELYLIAKSIRAGRGGGLSIAMAQRVDDLLGVFAPARGAAAARASDALDSAEYSIDLFLTVPGDFVPDGVNQLLEGLEEADVWARDGNLICGPATQEVAALRRWIAQQVTLQAAGAAPSPFAGV